MNRIAALGFTALGLALAVGLATPAFPADPQPHFVTIGTGAVTGVYYPVGGAVCRLVNRARIQTNLRCAVEATDGTLSNLTAMRAGDLDMGIVQSDWLFHAYKGTARFRDVGPSERLRSVLGLHAEPLTVLARADSRIGKFDDLRGKRVNVGAPGSGSRATIDVVLKAWGWTLKDFSEATELPVAEQGEVLCAGLVDAIVFAVAHPNAVVHEAAASCPTRLVEVSGAPVKRLIAGSPFHARAIIPGGLYPGTDEDIETFGVRAVLAASTRVGADVVFDVVKAVFENFDEFRTLHPALQALDKDAMATDGLGAPLHDGAARFFDLH
jgi:TRAP transporter TAXI family solute receptor